MSDLKRKSLDQFQKSMYHITDIPEQEWMDFEERLTLRKLDKGVPLVRQGEVTRTMAFVVEGLLRKFYVDESGSDFTKLFCMEHGYVSSFAAFISGEPSCFGIEAMEPTVLVTFEYDHFKVFMERHPCWLRIYNAALERFYLIK